MSSRQAIRVLIVEDETLVGEMLKHVLARGDYTVVGWASGGKQAIEQVGRLQPDVVLMDIVLPDMDGIEATRLIQERSPVPIVMLTAYDTPEAVAAASQAGAGSFLIKPPSLRELDRAITITIARFADGMELRRLNAELEQENAERRRVEVELRQALIDNEVLMKEIHHRVKNNLAVISSLLELQANRSENASVQAVFRESQLRIQSMARIHEHLYRASNLREVEMATYLRDVVAALRRSYGAQSVRIELALDEMALDIDSAITMGLIVTELVSNAFKYAFPAHAEFAADHVSFIRVSLCQDQDIIAFEVRDNGVGIVDPHQDSIEEPRSLGVSLVSLLARQLRGAFTLDSAPGQGTMAGVRFPRP